MQSKRTCEQRSDNPILVCRAGWRRIRHARERVTRFMKRSQHPLRSERASVFHLSGEHKRRPFGQPGPHGYFTRATRSCWGWQMAWRACAGEVGADHAQTRPAIYQRTPSLIPSALSRRFGLAAIANFITHPPNTACGARVRPSSHACAAGIRVLGSAVIRVVSDPGSRISTHDRIIRGSSPRLLRPYPGTPKTPGANRIFN